MSNPDIPNDEIRRQLRTVDRTNEAVVPQWREMLERIFSGDTRLSTDETAAVLGVPSPNARRNLFRLGGAGILGAALLAACSDDSNVATSTTASGSGDGSQDLVLARTAASLEKLAVDVYGQAAALLTTPAILEAATMFAGHHQMHMDALNGVITGAGGTAVTEANQAVFDALIAPALSTAQTENDAVMIALSLEEAAAQTYVYAGGTLSTPALRSTIMTIGGVEARHAAVLRMAALGQSGLDVFPDQRAFFPGDNPLAGIDGALITS